MHFPTSLVGAALIISVICQVSGMQTVIRQYGTKIEVPCNNGSVNPNAFMTKWKYEKEGVSGDLLVKMQSTNTSITATDSYQDRVSMALNFSLLISDATLDDQNNFICMVVDGTNILEFPVRVVIHKTPSVLEFSEKAEELEIGKLTKLGQCSAQDAHPAASITWFRNGKPLVSDEEGVIITDSVKLDETTGLSTTISALQYTAEKEDADAQFTCGALTLLTNAQTFTVTYPTEKVSLQVISEGLVTEGATVTLKCKADGNPPPTSFNFHIKGEVMKLENEDTYILTNVTRENTGEYKCSLINDSTMVASENITVNYLDITLSPSGKVTNGVGESVDLDLKTDASGEFTVSWRKDGNKLANKPTFDKLTYSDSGLYECEVTMGDLVRTASFQLVVEGRPVIHKLTEKRGEDGQHKVLVCEAEGFPKPTVAWSINGTSPQEISYLNGKVTYKLTIVPRVNLTVSCTVTNRLGGVDKDIYVSSNGSDETDQTKLVVGLVLGLLLVAAIVGVAYFMYLRRSKQGSCKTGEKEEGSSEETKNLETKNLEENGQKAEV